MSVDTQLSHSPAARRICNNAIFVTGNGRSGTTILGKLIHSLQSVEYVFEPPMLDFLLPLATDMNEAHFRLLFEAYLYDELLTGQVTGRAFNLNRNDDSCILVAKPRDEVERRLNTAWSRAASVAAAEHARLAVKMPNLTGDLTPLRRLYPGMTFVVTQRDPNPVIQSVLQKGWFTDEALQQVDVVAPSRTPDFVTPAWVAAEDVEAWRGWSELERAGYYYIRVGGRAEQVDGVITVSYERLVEAPRKVVLELADRLGLAFGPLTQSLIAETYAKSELSDDWVAKLPATWRARIREMQA